MPTMRERRKFFRRSLGNGARLVLFGALTGAFVGVIVTLYTVLASLAEDFSRGYYGFFRDHPAFIISYAPYDNPEPSVRRACARRRDRGRICPLFALHPRERHPADGGGDARPHALFLVPLPDGHVRRQPFMYLFGDVRRLGGARHPPRRETLRANALIRRYQITGGACAGLAVAFNAPLTGMAFAFEEGQKRFTPEVFVCAFTSVVVAVLIRNALYAAFGLPVGAYFSTFSFAQADMLAPMFYLYVPPSSYRSPARDFILSCSRSKSCLRSSLSGRGWASFLFPSCLRGQPAW